jgi:tyrosine-protein kinase Etk/Wzc
MEFSLLEYWAAVKRRRGFVLKMVGGVFALSVVVSLLLPKTYAATARVLPPPQKNTLGSTLMAGLAQNADFVSDSLLDTNKSSDLWAEILASRTVGDAVVQRFGLTKVYGKKTAEDARECLEKRVVIKKSKAGIVSVTVEDGLPGRAADMANAFVDELDRINKYVAMGSGTRARVFLEGRLEETRAGLSGAEKALNEFQRKNGAVKLDDQSEAVIKAIGSARGELMAKEVELHTTLSYATEDNPKVGMLKAEIAGLRREVGKMEVAGRGHDASDVLIPASRFPDLNLQYARLLRDIKIRQALYESLLAQYEQAKIAEAKDSPTVQVLDRAAAPSRKLRPARVQIVALSTLLSLFLAPLLAIVADGYGRKRRDTA